MLKRYTVVFIVALILTSVGLSQSFKDREIKVKSVAPKLMSNALEETSFYTDYRTRQVIANRTKKIAGTPVEFIVANWDWPANSYFPRIAGALDFTGDGVLDPVLLVTGNTLEQAPATAGRYAIFGYIDDFGASTYLPYGFNGSFVRRTGWNSHVIMDDANGLCYLSMYDFLDDDALIDNHLWVVDLMNDPSTATQLTDSVNALQGGWNRMALDGNGTFWAGADLSAVKMTLGIAASTDGGHIFTLIDSVGSNDATFWGSAFGNDPVLNAAGNKISHVTIAVKNGSLAELGLTTPGTTDPDSANGLYHWYSNDGGASFQGEWILRDGEAALSNRPNYEVAFANYDVGSQYVDPKEVTHVVMGGVNSAGLVGPDTINVYPVMYYNDRDKVWMSLETETVETYPYDSPLSWGNSIGSGRPVVQTDSSGLVVVAMWNRPQFTGEPGNSDISIYDGTTDFYNYDIVYTYSSDGGTTWSIPEVIYTSPDQCSIWPNIGAVEVHYNTDDIYTATVHYVFYWDKIPGAFILGAGQNEKSTDNVWYYSTQDFEVDLPVSVGNENIVDKFKLSQNYPNPFNPSTQIKYSVAERSNVTLKVYDVLGKEVATIVNTTKDAGSYEVNFDAANLSSGLYIYKIQVGNFTSSKKMMLLK